MKTILLFDVDGTLTEPRKRITHDMIHILSDLKQKYSNLEIGYVGGSNLCKQKEQLGEENFDLFDWRFSENGLEGYYCDKLIHTESFVRVMEEIHYSKFINICLYVLSTLECPVKRGTFIEYRNGMLNISPIGRACSQEERDAFEMYDVEHNVRNTMISNIQTLWQDYLLTLGDTNIPALKFSIGGQISVDVFPVGWDKTYCLSFLDPETYSTIHFFGDKTHEGGNDYEIYNHPRVSGHKVDNYNETISIIKTMYTNL